MILGRKNILKFFKKYTLNEILVKIFTKISIEYNLYLFIHRKIDLKTAISRLYYIYIRKTLNLDNPVSFNEKLQWMKVFYRDPLANVCADKLKVREYVRQNVSSDILNPLYHVYNSVDELDLKALPDKFVLKTTHCSGDVLVVTDKHHINWKKELNHFKKLLRFDYSLVSFEWPYKTNEPKLICEKLIENTNGEGINDYKFFCFNGKVKMLIYVFDRFKESGMKINFYTPEWDLLDVQLKPYPNNPIDRIEKPKKLNEMIQIAEKLSKPFPHVRVDMYFVNNKIIFSELTFFQVGGFNQFIPESFDIKMGEWLALPSKNYDTQFAE